MISHQKTYQTLFQLLSEDRNLKTSHRSAALISTIKGLFDLISQYPLDLEISHPELGSDFLALLAEEASRAMRGQHVYTPQISQKTTRGNNKSTRAHIAANDQNHEVISFKKQTLRASAPWGQNMEDQYVIIKLNPNHKSRKTGAYKLKQIIMKLVPDSYLVSNFWTVHSGVAILAPIPSKTASILQAKAEIEK